MLISGCLRFHVLHSIYKNFKLYLQNTLNMLKMTRVYFRVLQILQQRDEEWREKLAHRDRALRAELKEREKAFVTAKLMRD